MTKSLLLELPSELLEHRVCQFLDVASVTRLSLVNRRLQQDVSSCAELWELFVARHFGYVNKPSLILRRTRICSVKTDKAAIDWKAVFVAAWQDSRSLSAATLQERDVLQVYYGKSCPMLLQPRESQIRQEIVLMQGLRRIPASSKLIQLYANVIRQSHVIPRANTATTAKVLRRLAQ
ncbi:hypothetical protein PHYSODRAFT_346008 [Phytophthora sojae]|uniref:F-box domain-containing protein n=1 Tax=Phytophthora sojae (strain P6497) TaxID=1094619 RepID=G4ZH81_PHYSP|nr:hypothetical protein PHYSODRAFT_346008 [Phytophthora sojae]EGZ16753.1 hypothetical protein PHYSODRAFT_346008 [Phytophthora sojae]|eukprot:XP_009525811.1 hypothetical protein PHYSODRAFT_346008 [Phytophthora sojae]